jgi:hypothetical protein
MRSTVPLRLSQLGPALEGGSQGAGETSDTGPSLRYLSTECDEIDALIGRVILARRERCVRALIGIGESEGILLHPGFAAFLQRVADASAVDAIRMFDDHWAACIFSHKPATLVDDVEFELLSIDRLRWLLTAYAEHGPERGFAILPTAKDPLDYVYLPGQNAIVQVRDGPVAAFLDPDRVQFVSSSGACFTFRRSLDSIPRGVHARGAAVGPQNVGGFAVVNGIPLFGKLIRSPLPKPDEVSRSISVVSAGLQLLDAVWPAVRSFAERWLRGLLILRYAGYSRSHTSVHAPQVIMCSAESAVKVAEALCHELSHARMDLLAEETPIVNDDFVPRHTSPWRRDSRPIIGLIKGVHAFLSVCELYDRLAKFDAKWSKVAETTTSTQRIKIESAWSYIRENASWTPAGEEVANHLNRAVKALCG